MSDPRGPRRARRGVLVLAVVAAASTSACGAVLGSSTTPDGDPIPSQDDLYAAVREATAAARSGHVTGFVTMDDEAMTVDIEGTVDGRNQRFRQATDTGGKVTILTVKGKTYLSGDWDFWASAAGDPKVGDALKGKQVLMPKQGLEGVAKKLTLSALLEPAVAAAHSGILSRFTDSVSLRRENDHEIWVIHEGDDEVWVDRKSGRLVKLVDTGDEPSELTFDKWDAARRFKAPARATVFKP